MSGKLSYTLLLISLVIYRCTSVPQPEKPESLQGRNIIADSGMVVSAHPESSRIGMEILKAGGNAVDAAVATEFALAVCYPEAGNIGGGGFMVIRNADGTSDVIDYREKAPLLASENMYLDRDGNVVEGLSTDTHLAAGVPGTVEGMVNIHSKYGILPFKTVIQPAINLARKGFPLTSGQAEDLNNNRERFLRKNAGRTAFVKETPWQTGDTLKQPDLAGTLERIRDYGRDGFYSGTTAKLIVREMQRGNGIISEKDLSDYRSVFRDPIKAEYRGYRIITVAPPSGGGIILLQVLGMLQPSDLGKMGFHTPASIHLIVEAEKRAFADRSKFLGDPDFMTTGYLKLLNPEYLKGRMSSFDEKAATPSSMIQAGNPPQYESEETTHYSVVDRMGNAVSATTTLNNIFGSSIVVDSAGFLLNDEMDDFSVKPGVPNMYGLTGSEANSIQPGKRMLSSMTPVIIEKNDSLFLVAGSPGGSTIPTTVLQVVTNIIDFGMDLRKAVDTGRYHHQWIPDYISYERNSLSPSTISNLEMMGYDLRERRSIGMVNAVMVLPDGRYKGCGDSRGENSACGY